MSPVGTVPLWARDTVDEIKSAPQTFSSWDKCMAKSYCKWPVIVGIIVGSVILLSIVACIINCFCCGIQCCKGCCECCSCCCPSPRSRPNRTKYLDDDPIYHQPPPPPPSNAYRPPPAPVYRGQQVARFDTPSSPRVNEDALPAMPTWDNAVTRKVEDTSPRDDMEMEPLNPAQHRARSPANALYADPLRRTPSPANALYADPLRRTPSPARPGYAMTSPGPVNSYNTGYRGFDDQSNYGPRSPTIASPAPFSAYDQQQPYNAYAFANPYQSRTGTPATAYSQPHYTPMPAAVSPAPMTPYAPLRQPSPSSFQPSVQPPSYTTQPPYRGMSPTLPTSPPPPFPSAPTPVPHEVVNDPGRPPSLLQSGRRPAPNTYRDV